MKFSFSEQVNAFLLCVLGFFIGSIVASML